MSSQPAPVIRYVCSKKVKRSSDGDRVANIKVLTLAETIHKLTSLPKNRRTFAEYMDKTSQPVKPYFDFEFYIHKDYVADVMEANNKLCVCVKKIAEFMCDPNCTFIPIQVAMSHRAPAIGANPAHPDDWKFSFHAIVNGAKINHWNIPHLINELSLCRDYRGRS